MSEQLINSDSVKIFPSTKRADQQHSSRALTQAALVGLVNQLLDRQSFVISQNDDNEIFNLQNNQFIQVNICGYYFKVRTSQITSFIGDTSIQSIYLCAKFLQGSSAYSVEYLPRMNLIGNDQSYIQFDGQMDSNQKVQGLKLSDTEISTNGWKSILILEKSENYWKIPSGSQIKFNLTRLPSTQISGVDGGDGT